MPTIFDHFVVLKPELLLEQLRVNPDIYAELDQRYDGFRSHTLVSAHHFSENWPTWERHPAGDELVILLSGRARFFLRSASGDESVVLEEPGAFVMVPANTWHTAHIDEPTSLLFVTPGEGTENEESPAADM